MTRTRKVLLWVVGGLVGVSFIVVGVGLSLPESHSASVTRVVGGTPDEVWAVMTDVDAFPTWRSDVDRSERLPSRGGLPVWREEGSSGTMTYEVTAFDPPARIVTRIADEGLPFGGMWTYELAPSGAGTLVTLTEDGEIYNPIFRFVARFVVGYEATMVTYIDGLEARMGR